MTMVSVALHVDGVSKRYLHRVKGEIYAARDVRLDVRPGEFLTLLGPSGCGKTTTLRMIAGFEKPDAGRIHFDEPLSNLDAKLRVQMRHEIRALQRRLGITTVYVTHDQEEAMAVSDRIVVMDHGSVVQQGTAEDLYYRPASQFVAGFIGRVNLIAGTATRTPDGSPGVAALGTVIVAANLPGGLALGDAVQLLLRPEA